MTQTAQKETPSDKFSISAKFDTSWYQAEQHQVLNLASDRC
jgi:hypothetical protein